MDQHHKFIRIGGDRKTRSKSSPKNGRRTSARSGSRNNVFSIRRLRIAAYYDGVALVIANSIRNNHYYADE